MMEIRRVSGHEGQSRMWNLLSCGESFQGLGFFRARPWLVSGSGPVFTPSDSLS